MREESRNLREEEHSVRKEREVDSTKLEIFAYDMVICWLADGF